MSAQANPIHRAYVALGSNLGTPVGGPAATLRAGMRALSEAVGVELRTSSLYRTMPVGYRNQPMFINAVACLETSRAPEDLLEVLLAVEQKFGRERATVDGPRTLDLDLLMVDDFVLETTTLVLPHPRMAERRFVLAPLAEIAPGLVHPVLGRTVEELLSALPDAGEQAIAGVQRLESVLGP